MVMRDVDIILATGGPGMVKAAYSSGKPALGVGAGNTPVVIDDTADVLLAVNSIIHSKTFDNGMICASEQSVTVIDTIYDRSRPSSRSAAATSSSRVPRWRPCVPPCSRTAPSTTASPAWLPPRSLSSPASRFPPRPRS